MNKINNNNMFQNKMIFPLNKLGKVNFSETGDNSSTDKFCTVLVISRSENVITKNNSVSPHLICSSAVIFGDEIYEIKANLQNLHRNLIDMSCDVDGINLYMVTRHIYENKHYEYRNINIHEFALSDFIEHMDDKMAIGKNKIEQYEYWNKSIFIFEDITYREIQTKFLSNKVIISGGSRTKRHLLSPAQFRLSQFLIALCNLPVKSMVKSYYSPKLFKSSSPPSPSMPRARADACTEREPTH